MSSDPDPKKATSTSTEPTSSDEPRAPSPPKQTATSRWKGIVDGKVVSLEEWGEDFYRRFSAAYETRLREIEAEHRRMREEEALREARMTPREREKRAIREAKVTEAGLRSLDAQLETRVARFEASMAKREAQARALPQDSPRRADLIASLEREKAEGNASHERWREQLRRWRAQNEALKEFARAWNETKRLGAKPKQG